MNGQTKEQMLRAPYGAIFIWCNGSIPYARDLAYHLGRDDLRIHAISFLDNDSQWRGLEPSGIVIDHAAALTHRQAIAVSEILRRVKGGPVGLNRQIVDAMVDSARRYAQQNGLPEVAVTYSDIAQQRHWVGRIKFYGNWKALPIKWEPAIEPGQDGTNV